MSKRLEDLRKGIRVEPSSLNQKGLKLGTERSQRFFGTDRKAHKAMEQKIREEDFVRQLPKLQYERALHHMLDGTATPEEAYYFFKMVDEGFGKLVDEKVTFVFHTAHKEK